MHVCLCMYICIFVCVHMYLCIYVYIYIYICIYYIHSCRFGDMDIKDMHVLDVGTGNGMMAVLLRDEGFAQITATDYLVDSVSVFMSMCVYVCMYYV
jgi:2-polyprenyl-3-methyl-5-hydroxy-6-metoxy-1,4-benzoquinol methylase